MSSRWKGRNADAGEAADSGTSLVYTRWCVVTRCTNTKGTALSTSVHAAAFSLPFSRTKSEPLQTPAPGTIHSPSPTFAENDSTHVVDSPWRPPLLPVVVVRHKSSAVVYFPIALQRPFRPTTALALPPQTDSPRTRRHAERDIKHHVLYTSQDP